MALENFVYSCGWMSLNFEMNACLVQSTINSLTKNREPNSHHRHSQAEEATHCSFWRC